LDQSFFFFSTFLLFLFLFLYFFILFFKIWFIFIQFAFFSISEYDFQLCVPQNDVKDTLESRDLEASFCRDFECCGLVLNDLHDLLQHYEEYHVRSEDDDGSFFDDSDCSWSSPLSPFSTSSMDESIPSSPISDDEFTNLDALKKRAAAYLSDLYNASSSASVSSTLSTPASPILLNDELNSEENTQASASSATVGASSVSKKTAGKKRSYSQYNGSPSALDLLTQSAAKKLALASSLNGGDIPTPILTDEDFLAQAGALLASTNTSKYFF
jgi:hypothetical protein